MSDKEVWDLSRGGHDYRKVYAAFKAAVEHKGQPTVILAKTIKGWTLGNHFEGRNSTHQMKKLTAEDLAAFRDRLYLPIPDEQLDKTLPPYYKPEPDSDEMQYMLERRRALGGAVPRRRSEFKQLKAPDDKALDVLRRGSGKQEVATTMAFVRLLKELLKDKELGPRFVPVIPDEARTFGMDSLFPSQKIYNPAGQRYTSVDREPDAGLQGVREGPAAARGHQRGGLDRVVHRRRHVVRHARRADDPDLHLLLDVRVPADR
jgi:pyruvate dehydrogenase E1 component